jgi:hypothetical protein
MLQSIMKLKRMDFLLKCKTLILKNVDDQPFTQSTRVKGLCRLCEKV